MKNNDFEIRTSEPSAADKIDFLAYPALISVAALFINRAFYLSASSLTVFSVVAALIFLAAEIFETQIPDTISTTDSS